MPFVSSNVSVSEPSDRFAAITYTDPATEKQRSVSFALKDAYSHFGVSVGKSPFGKDKTYTLPVQLDRLEQVGNFKAAADQCAKLLGIDGPLLKCMCEKDGRTVMYLKLSKEQVGTITAGKSCTVSASIMFASVYLSDAEKGYTPSLTVRVRRIDMKPCDRRTFTFGDTDESDIDED